jgi:hypothetical protein
VVSEWSARKFRAALLTFNQSFEIDRVSFLSLVGSYIAYPLKWATAQT